MAGGIAFAFTTEVSPGAGTKIAAIELPDSVFLQKFVLTDADGNPISTSNPLPSSDVSNGGGVEGFVTIGTTPTELKVGASALPGRISLTLLNNSETDDIFWGYDVSVSPTNGTPVFPQQFLEWSVGVGTKVFVVAAVAGVNGRCTEAAA